MVFDKLQNFNFEPAPNSREINDLPGLYSFLEEKIDGGMEITGLNISATSCCFLWSSR